MTLAILGVAFYAVWFVFGFADGLQSVRISMLKLFLFILLYLVTCFLAHTPKVVTCKLLERVLILSQMSLNIPN